MVFIGYDAMLKHGQETTGTPGCGRFGSAPLRGAAARPAPTGPGGDGAAAGAAAARLRHRSLDAAARRDGHRSADRGSLSSGPRLVPLARAAVVAATARTARTRAGRGGGSAVGPAPLARSKKKRPPPARPA